MSELVVRMNELLDATPWLASVVAVAALILAASIANFITKSILVRGLLSLLHVKDPVDTKATPGQFRRYGFIKRLANVVPALVITFGIRYVTGLPEPAVVVVMNVANAFIVLTLAMAVSNMLDMANDVYQQRPDAAARPIKGYLQVLKIFIYAITVLLIIATLLDRSPLILLSGLGALAAVLMLVFQDTILSLVASVQISSNDIVRVGDWVEMPQLNADGDVIDIALHTVKVQNWDRTITTIPTKRFISDSFKNWRGMQESGGRRIKRAVYLDQTSVRFLSAEEKQHLGAISLLGEYLSAKQKELDDWNASLAERGKEPANTRRITNLGTFRAYVERYLRNHPQVHQKMTLIVRHLNPGPEGLPLEIYCFTNTIEWVPYEGIQADIFDHLLSILPEFGLRVFQQPSGFDMTQWINAARAESRATLQPAQQPAEQLIPQPIQQPIQQNPQEET
ncbi:MAG: mechanosensitive ion channel family protein [Pseudohongiella sp.]|nr:mechanosensitive ion channel family protein [Pseudohongiella sp.]